MAGLDHLVDYWFWGPALRRHSLHERGDSNCEKETRADLPFATKWPQHLFPPVAAMVSSVLLCAVTGIFLWTMDCESVPFLRRLAGCGDVHEGSQTFIFPIPNVSQLHLRFHGCLPSL